MPRDQTEHRSSDDHAPYESGGPGAQYLPHGTTTQRPSVPRGGMLRYNETTGKVEAYENGLWVELSSGGGGGGGAPTNASYVTVAAEAGLSAERAITAGDGIALDDAGANTTITVRTRSTVFITGVTGLGTISNKTYEPNTVPSNKILTGFESDNDNITLTLEIHAATDAWMPDSVTVSGAGITPVTVLKQNWTQVGSSRIWTASANIPDASTSGILTATLSDGDTATVNYTRSLDPPKVLSIAWDNQGTNPDPYPGVQTQFKNGDTMKVTITTESHADEVYVKDVSGSATQGRGLQGPYLVTGGSTGSISVIAGSANNTTAQLVAYAKVTGGTNGPDFDSELDQTPATIECDQTSPTFSGGTQSDIAYPVGQEALKNVETCDITVTHTNPATGDTYLYDDNGTGELSIPNPTVYSAIKTGVARTAGNYRESGTNYRLTVTRTQKNGKSATKNVTVKIAHTAPSLTVTPTSRFGTDDGTNGYRDHTVTITSSQATLSTHTATMTTDPGDTSAFTGAWTRTTNTTYTNTLRVEDADINAGGQAANNFSWAGVSVKNRAGVETTTIATNPNYSIGGFQTRRLTIAAWPNREANIGCRVVDTAKLWCENLSKGGSGPGGGTVQTFDNSPGQGLTPDDELDKFCISDGAALVDDDGQYYYNKDQPNAESNTSGTAQLDIKEDP